MVYDFLFFDFVLRLKFSLSIGIACSLYKILLAAVYQSLSVIKSLGEYVCKQVNLICRKRESV